MASAWASASRSLTRRPIRSASVRASASAAWASAGGRSGALASKSRLQRMEVIGARSSSDTAHGSEYTPGHQPATNEGEGQNQGAPTGEQGAQVSQRLLDILLRTSGLNDVHAARGRDSTVYAHVLTMVHDRSIEAACAIV